MRKIPIPLLFGAAIVGAGIMICTLPSPIALPCLLLWSAACGWWSSPRLLNPFKAAMLLLLAAFGALLLLFVLLPQFFKEIQFYALAASMGYAFWWGASLGKGNEIYPKKAISFFGLGIVALFSTVGFSFLGNEDYGVYGHVFIYITAGIVLQRGGVSLLKQFLFVAPIVMQGIFQNITEPSNFAWFLHTVIPLSSVLALVVGNLVAKEGYAFKIAGLVFVSLAIFLNEHLFPVMLQKSSWEVDLSSGTVPQFELVGLDDDTLSNVHIDQKVTWFELYNRVCRSCILQMASVEKVAQVFEKRQDVTFITVSSAYYEDHEAFLAATNFLKFKLWHGYEYDGVLAKRFAPTGVPVGVLIDKKGNVRYGKLGFGKNDAPYFEADLEAKIRAILAEG